MRFEKEYPLTDWTGRFTDTLMRDLCLALQIRVTVLPDIKSGVLRCTAEQDEPELAGYSVKELIAFAELCRSQGVGPDEMHQSMRDAGKVADLIWAEVQKRMYEAVHQTAAQLTGEDTTLIDKVMSYTKEAPET